MKTLIRALGMMTGCAAAMVMLSCSGTTPGGSAPDAGCDGCSTETGACVPLAQTSRDQCGRGGQSCFTCPACDQGRCSTGWECFGIRPPDPCECGFRCIEGVGSEQCGICSASTTCVANRCVALDAGTDGGALDGGADAGARDGG
ncbi:MAG: hypothetical protein JNM69_05770 [Archangium sp.]|nr:hypothetical protein [Archangium sp.]